MITIEQAKVIGAVLKRFNDGETLDWTDIDEAIHYLTWLNDHQLVIESSMLLDIHRRNDGRCEKDHPREQCFIPVVLDAVSYIVDDFMTSNRLAKKARFVLEYYLALSQVGTIVHD